MRIVRIVVLAALCAGTLAVLLNRGQAISHSLRFGPASSAPEISAGRVPLSAQESQRVLQGPQDFETRCKAPVVDIDVDDAGR